MIVFLAAFTVLCVLSAPLTKKAVRDDPAAKLLGEWTVAGKFGTGDGKAVFRADMTYLLKEIHPDGLAVTHEGQYKLDPSQEPWVIDLCVGRFSNPGSEWVTTFGILRFISDDEAEIHFDPSGRRPGSFDGATAENTHKMTRKRSDG
jgi:hypothetical protein